VRVSINQNHANSVSVQLEGPFTIETVPEIRRQVLKAARGRAIKGLFMDLHRVSSMDTGGIALLVELLRLLSRKQGELRLSGLSDNISRMIHLARLDTTFQIDEHTGERDLENASS